MLPFTGVAVFLAMVYGGMANLRDYGRNQPHSLVDPLVDPIPVDPFPLPVEPRPFPVDPFPSPVDPMPLPVAPLPVPRPGGGRCPNVQYPCGRLDCSSDRDCRRREVCCHQGCASRCVRPGSTQPQGKCPSIQYPCGRLDCSGDSDCHRGDLCCHQGCASRCERPTKPGVCPRVRGQPRNFRRRQNRRRCQRPCTRDTDCSGRDKCCESDGCGMVCTSPRRF